jgi:ABC-type multidrug transport system fused ATPase/permease subunit
MKTFFELINLFPKNTRSFIFSIPILLFLTTLLEFASIGLIIPIFNNLSNEKINEKLFYIPFFFDLEKDKLIFFLLFIFLFFFIIKNVFLLLLYNLQNKFTWLIYNNLSIRLLKSYLKKSYNFYYEKNSAVLINNVILETKNVSLIIHKTILILVEISVLLGILFFLLYFSPLVTSFLCFILVTFYLVFNKVSKNRLDKLGRVRLNSSYNQTKNLQQIFSSIKEIKLRASETYFSNIFKNHLDIFCYAAEKQGFSLEVPKILIEIAFVLLIILLIFLFKIFQFENLSLIGFLSIFIIAAFRTIPGLNRILNAKQVIKYYTSSLKDLKFDLIDKSEDNPKKYFIKNLLFENLIFINKVSYTYPNSKKIILNNISFKIKKNEFIGIIGKSGVGKSTLLDIIMGLITPIKGEVLIDNININLNLSSWQKKIGYVPQSVYLLDDSIKKNIAYGLIIEPKDEVKLIDVCRKAHIFNFINTLPKKFNTTVGEKGIKLSGGQIQRLGIARALYNNPEVLIFDEATSSLDTKTENDFLNSLELLRGKITIIFVSHRKSSLKNCDKIINLERFI